ncbi:hypothetical protein ABVK25_009159 [Lepraria finkii]|uniref:Serine hydrolase domain-containing protein n=1 Tax=Lepraria finkii TaxID=1340010 RepID=A0ABR4AYW3_9LECA
MKFLCLPGAFTSAETFKIQLQPLVKALQQGGDDITFHFTQGPIPAPPPPEFQTFFGNPPHWRFIALEGESSMEALDKHRNFCAQEDPEESVRKIVQCPG